MKTVIKVRDLSHVVSFVILQGIAEQRQQFATDLVGVQQQLPVD